MPVHVSVEGSDPKLVAYAVGVRLSASRDLWVPSKGAVSRVVQGVTWQRDIMLTMPSNERSDTVEQRIGEMSDEFVNDWMAAHNR